jgi:hypothetical protein
LTSLAVQNTCNASVESKGFCFYKATNGIKRHLAVDRLGFPFFTHCTKANISDDAGLIEMLTHNIDYFRSKPMNIPKITILLDHGYHPEHLVQQLEQVYPGIMRKIRFERAGVALDTREGSTRKIWICSSSCKVGEANGQMLGWSDVRSWSRTSSAPYQMQPQSLISALSN